MSLFIPTTYFKGFAAKVLICWIEVLYQIYYTVLAKNFFIPKQIWPMSFANGWKIQEISREETCSITQKHFKAGYIQFLIGNTNSF